MKELGEYLKEQRESNGVELEEASEDLDISKEDLDNIEQGNIRAFKDVLSLKNKIKSYAKYLGLDPEKVLDEFNDFMFEHTSKIALSDILEAEKKVNEGSKKISSPYTKIKKKKVNTKGISIFMLALVIVIVLILILIKLLEPKEPIINKELSSKGAKYEYTY